VPYILAVLRDGQGWEKEKEVRIFYIAYMIRLAHESSGYDENSYTTRDNDVASMYPSRIARASVKFLYIFTR